MADARSFLSGLLSDSPRFLFFTGKGGVGKTTRRQRPRSRWPIKGLASRWF
ncbi:MAG: hypothetical protein MP439_10965 [Ferrimicrobium sp.]|nr:hypothetical protein [Ferrimicrobium sp.]